MQCHDFHIFKVFSTTLIQVKSTSHRILLLLLLSRNQKLATGHQKAATLPFFLAFT